MLHSVARSGWATVRVCPEEPAQRLANSENQKELSAVSESTASLGADVGPQWPQTLTTLGKIASASLCLASDARGTCRLGQPDAEDSHARN